MRLFCASIGMFSSNTHTHFLNRCSRSVLKFAHAWAPSRAAHNTNKLGKKSAIIRHTYINAYRRRHQRRRLSSRTLRSTYLYTLYTVIFKSSALPFISRSGSHLRSLADHTNFKDRTLLFVIYVYTNTICIEDVDGRVLWFIVYNWKCGNIYFSNSLSLSLTIAQRRIIYAK